MLGGKTPMPERTKTREARLLRREVSQLGKYLDQIYGCLEAAYEHVEQLSKKADALASDEEGSGDVEDAS
jgi:hypothetical protein